MFYGVADINLCFFFIYLTPTLVRCSREDLRSVHFDFMTVSKHGISFFSSIRFAIGLWLKTIFWTHIVRNRTRWFLVLYLHSFRLRTVQTNPKRDHNVRHTTRLDRTCAFHPCAFHPCVFHVIVTISYYCVQCPRSLNLDLFQLVNRTYQHIKMHYCVLFDRRLPLSNSQSNRLPRRWPNAAQWLVYTPEFYRPSHQYTGEISRVQNDDSDDRGHPARIIFKYVWYVLI